MNVFEVYYALDAFGSRYAFHKARQRVGILRALYLIWVARSM